MSKEEKSTIYNSIYDNVGLETKKYFKQPKDLISRFISFNSWLFRGVVGMWQVFVEDVTYRGCGSTSEKREILIRNESIEDIELEWLCEEDCSYVRLIIEPQQLVCPAFSVTNCSLSAEALQEGTFHVTYRCVSYSKHIALDLLISGVCREGKLSIVKDTVDFGLIKRSSEKMCTVIAKNCSSADCVHWTLREMQYDPYDGGQLYPSNKFEPLSASEGTFCHKDSEVLVKYQLNTEADKMWCSVLDWSGEYVSVLAAIQDPDVSLSCHVLRPEQLFLNTPVTMKLTVHNNTLLQSAVCWGVVVGDGLQVNVEPRCILLQPSELLPTEITITPLKVGPLHHVYIPCFVENEPQPLLLQVEGVVEGLRVRVEWDCETKHYCVYWPGNKHTKSEENVNPSLSLGSIICKCPNNSFTSIPDTSDEFINLKEYIEDVNDLSQSEEEMSVKTNTNKELERDKEDSNVSKISSIPYLNWPIIGGRYTREPMSESIEKQFNNLFLEELSYYSADESSRSYLDNGICFNDIPVKKAVTKTIYIRNDTLISSFFKTCIVNNFERPREADSLPIIERVEKKIKYKDSYDEWQRRACKDRGLTVFIEPDCGELLPDNYVCLQLTAFANSWGHYYDALVVELPGLDELYLQLIATVYQLPLSVPSIVRFGAVSFSAGPQYYNIKVTNSSSVPLYVCWEIFDPAKELPFNIILFDAIPFELGITPCYGSEKSIHFQVCERYTLVDPHTSSAVRIKLKPYCSAINVACGILSETLKAVLIGHVYLTNEARYITNTESCIRTDGQQMDPLKVDLEAYVELSVLSLLNVYNNQLIFKCFSHDVMSTPNKKWMEKKVITVQNQCLTDIESKVVTVGYFYISEVKYPCHQKEDYTQRNLIFLEPGETCELTLVCEVTEDCLNSTFEEELVPLPADECIEAGFIERGLITFEQPNLRQDVKLELWLYQPFIQFSTTYLNFGLVYIEDTKVLTVSLTAPIGNEYFETSIKSGTNSAFSITVESGTLEPNSVFILQVYFAPKSCIPYRDLLVIKTCISLIRWEIPLTGMGTFNYKAHTY